ncbi:hypothetical protein [Terrabacter sp. NPDC000476]
MLAWDKRGGAWYALVSYYLESEGVLAQQWLAADLLTKVGPT